MPGGGGPSSGSPPLWSRCVLTRCWGWELCSHRDDLEWCSVMFVEEAPRRQTHHQTGRGSYCVGCSLLGVLLGGWSPPQTWRWRETYFSPCGIEPWIRGQGGGVVCGSSWHMPAVQSVLAIVAMMMLLTEKTKNSISAVKATPEGDYNLILDHLLFYWEAP